MPELMEGLTIIKIGGNVLDNPREMKVFLDEFKKITGKKVLVHGGGKRATQLSAKLGIKSTMIDGRRITDAATLEVVTMVYGGLINKNLVAQLQSMNMNALGLTGADLNIIPARKRQNTEIDFGYVGDFHIHEINTKSFTWLLENDVIPVFCALTHDQKGSLLNTNADTMAAGIASALAKNYYVTLYYCFEKSGVLLNLENDIAIPDLSYDAFHDLKEKKIIAAGMLPKLENAFNALHAGVEQVIIGNVNGISSRKGTKLMDQ